jgi:hypothetical protein
VPWTDGKGNSTFSFIVTSFFPSSIEQSAPRHGQRVPTSDIDTLIQNEKEVHVLLATSGDYRPFRAASDHTWLLLSSFGHYWLLLTTTDHFWPWLVKNRPLLATTGHCWSLLATAGHCWPRIATTDHYWPLLATISQGYAPYFYGSILPRRV